MDNLHIENSESKMNFIYSLNYAGQQMTWFRADYARDL